MDKSFIYVSVLKFNNNFLKHGDLNNISVRQNDHLHERRAQTVCNSLLNKKRPICLKIEAKCLEIFENSI